MSQPNFNPGGPDANYAPPPTQIRGPVVKQPFSIYTVLLILSLIFLITAAIIFYVDVNKY